MLMRRCIPRFSELKVPASCTSFALASNGQRASVFSCLPERSKQTTHSKVLKDCKVGTMRCLQHEDSLLLGRRHHSAVRCTELSLCRGVTTSAHRCRGVHCRATQGGSEYAYRGPKGWERKATIEVLAPLQGKEAPQDGGPWQLGYQINERNVIWNDDLKLRLIKRIASEQLGISAEEMDWRLEQLAVLLPGLTDRLVRAPPALVARAAAHPDQIAARLLALRQAFPEADLSIMIGNRLTLLLDDDMDSVCVAATRLRQLLPGMAVDRFVADYPLVLDVDNFVMALDDCKRLMPDKDPVQLLRANPPMVISLVKGKNLIPYDEFSNPWH